MSSVKPLYLEEKLISSGFLDTSNILEFTRGAGSTEDAFILTASRLKACAKPLGPNLVQLTFVKIWQKSDESSKSAQM